MGIGSGIASQLMLSKETVYGTRVVPARTFEYQTENVQRQVQKVRSRQLRSGESMQRSTRLHTIRRSAAGSIGMEVPNQLFSAVLDIFHANVVTPVQQGGTAAYLHTHNIGNTEPSKSASIQLGRPSTDGTVRPFDYLGSMVTGFNFASDSESFLTCGLDIDAQDEKTDQSLAVAAYPTNLLTFHGGQATVITVNGTQINTTLDFNLAMQFSRKLDRWYMGSTQTKAKPIENGTKVGTLGLSEEFVDLTRYGIYTADTIVPVVVSFVGPLIAGAFFQTIKFTAQACELAGETPTVNGMDTLVQPLAFNILDDGTNPPLKVEYTSVDVTV